MLQARKISLNLIRSYKQATLKELAVKINSNNISQKYQSALEKFTGRILFNSVLEVQSIRLEKYEQLLGKKRRKERELLERSVKPLPVVLNQLCEGSVEKLEQNEEDPKEDVQDLPHARYLKVENLTEKEEDTDEVAEKTTVPKNWLQDYEYYDESEEELTSFYGTPDLNIPVSIVPCKGCGALLHCKDGSIPGYVPSELFIPLNAAQLTQIHCQRCHFLINYNTAINVSVKEEDYINIISSIKDKFALAIIMVDLLDFPCSIFEGLSEILGADRPIFIVGNKIDLMPRDHPNYLNHIMDCLKKEAVKMGFSEKSIKNVSLISAKTGYGVEELITQLHNKWAYNGDVYLIGCTNVGKSSLFNALLRSDYCKVDASNIVQKATTCPWPGTTLRMLKFPILKPSGFRLFLRTNRLKMEKKKRFRDEQLRREQAMKTKDVKYATLIGHIGRSYSNTRDKDPEPFGGFSHDSGFGGNILTLNEKSVKYINSKWCFDTPGVIQKDQILHLLTTDEIIKVLPKEMLRCRGFLMKPNFSLFVGGLGRLDYIDGPESTRVLVYASMDLPITIIETHEAEEFYEIFLGSEVLGVPMDSGEERLAKWPKLEATHDKIVIEGEMKHITVCDIVLSSAGWIGVCLPQGITGTFKAWTPEKRGIYVRNPSLLPHGNALRGKRIRGKFAYLIGKGFTFARPK